MNSAILFLVFNRPELTRKVFESIRAAKPKRLYISADGPRAGKDGEIVKCNEVREIFSSIDWPCEIKTQYLNKNFGCKLGVLAGINWFFSHETEGIILEDDVLPSAEFFRFCDYGLEKYRYESRVGMISGCNLLGGSIKSDEYLYSQLAQIWGWATWKRAWSQYSPDLVDWPSQKRINYLKTKFNKKIAKYLIHIFNIHAQKNIDTWDTQWLYTFLFNGYLSVTPKANLTKNIGISGTHSSIETKSHNIPYGLIDSDNLSSPKCLLVDLDFDEAMANQYFGRALLVMRISSIARKLRVHSALKSLHGAIYAYKR